LTLSLACGLEAQPRYAPLPRPVVTVGGDGSPDAEFVQVAAAFRTSDGLLAVSDWGSPTIRVFDARGRLVRTLGRQGAGPGEFRLIQRLFLAHDTLIAYDGPLRRLTRYLPDGTLLGTTQVQPSTDGGPVDLVGRLSSGRWVVTTPHSPSWTHGHGVYRDTLRVGTLVPSAVGPVTWLAEAPGATFFAYMPGADRSQWLAGLLPMSATGVAAQLGDTIVVGDTESVDLLFFGPEGRRVGELALPLEPPPDLRPHRRAARDDALALDREGRRRAYLTAAAEFDGPAPRYRDLVIGTDGLLWLQLLEPRPGDSSRYLVLTPSGDVRARVSLPPRATLLTAQPPWLLVALRDEDGFERVGLIAWQAP